MNIIRVGGCDTMDTLPTVEDCVALLRQKAEGADHIKRFYLFVEDSNLYGMEYELSNSEQSNRFYEAVMDVYRGWRDDLGPEKWAEVVAHNNHLNGANHNALLDELEY